MNKLQALSKLSIDPQAEPSMELITDAICRKANDIGLKAFEKSGNKMNRMAFFSHQNCKFCDNSPAFVSQYKNEPLSVCHTSH